MGKKNFKNKVIEKCLFYLVVVFCYLVIVRFFICGGIGMDVFFKEFSYSIVVVFISRF